MAPHPGISDWRTIAEQITVETDTQKLNALVNQLCSALDEEAKRKRPTTLPSFPEQPPTTTAAIAEARS
jgi:hypothetical protein